MEYDNNNTGILSRNDRKTEDKHPEFKGQATIDGVDYWIDGRVRERKSDGGKFFSLRFNPKEAKPAQKPQAKGAQALTAMDDDIPF